MRATLDISILVGAVVLDDADQAARAASLTREADLLVIPTICLCELVWVLRQTCRLPATNIGSALRHLLASDKVVTDRPSAEAGLHLHDLGGDFADGVIEYQGRQAGAAVFMTFDRKAAKLMDRSGLAAMVPAA